MPTLVNFRCSITSVLHLEWIKNASVQYLCMLYIFVIIERYESASGSKNPLRFLHWRIDFVQLLINHKNRPTVSYEDVNQW